MYIMTVDDSRIMRKVISNSIEALGFDYLEAEDGLVCLNLLEQYEGQVALVLLDWNMPNMDGFSALKHIRANESTSHIPVMMVTTESERSRMVEAIRAGANQYLSKPFSEEDLMTKMVECLQDTLADAL
jgi:two-component system, chemotaxis family, chemotaxis protein CheY